MHCLLEPEFSVSLTTDQGVHCPVQTQAINTQLDSVNTQPNQPQIGHRASLLQLNSRSLQVCVVIS